MQIRRPVPFKSVIPANIILPLFQALFSTFHMDLPFNFKSSVSDTIISVLQAKDACTRSLSDLFKVI